METCIGDMEKGELLIIRAFSTARDPLLAQKIPCHLVASLKDKAVLNVSFKFGTIHYVFCRFRRSPGRSTGPIQMKSSMTSIRDI